MMNKTKLICWFSCLCLSLSHAATFYVSPAGNDQHPGTAERPLATFAGARDAVRASGDLGKEPIQVIFKEGNYTLSKPVVFTPADSGTPTAPVWYKAEAGAEVAILGGQVLDLQWNLLKDGILSATVPDDLNIDQLFVNQQLQRMARYPNYTPDVAIFNGYAADAWSAERVAGWADPTGGFAHVLHQNRWGSYHYLIQGKEDDGSLRKTGGWQTNRKDGIHDRYRFVENIREELDAPGEWYHDRKAGELLFIPPEGIDLANATIETASLRSLVELRGSQETPVRFIRFDGLTFRYASRTFMDTNEPIQRSDWAIYRGGALFIEGAEDCSFDQCLVEEMGGNGIFVSKYNRRIMFRTCRIQRCGASGIVFLGNPEAVRSGRTKEEPQIHAVDMDWMPGPLSDDYPAECVVEDCLISDLGRVEKQVAGVEISMARRITIRNCSIYEVPRAGIDVGTGRWGGHLIEGCDVFDTVQETGDHGSFNSWGRDRFFEQQGVDASELNELALIDSIEPTVIRNSRWRCDHGWDIDLDDGASNYYIYNNLMLNGGLKFRQGFRRHAWNNVLVNSSLDPHVWYSDSRDTFKHNIVMVAYRPARMPEGKWGKELDFNLFTSGESDRMAHQAHGADQHSRSGDPKFKDAASGNFSVTDDSPALAIGFKNFPMDQFGVRSPELKALARTPVIPEVRNSMSASTLPRYTWIGAEIRTLANGEYSAWGISSEAGGIVVLHAAGHSEAIEMGIRAGDLIYACAGKAIKNVEDFNKAITAYSEKEPLKLLLRRDGKRGVEVILPQRPHLAEKIN